MGNGRTAITRRRVLGALGAALMASCGRRSAEKKETNTMTTTRLPTMFIPHGGGPWPVLPLPMFPREEAEKLRTFMASLGDVPATRPRALLVVSAHWEASVITVNTGPAPAMFYDYGGFPKEAYELSWPAPGAPELAASVRGLLEERGYRVREDATRGYDHGTFIPLLLAYPDADIPVVQLSLKRTLDPAEHLAIGRALAPLREQGVFILGSGNSYHNMNGFFDPNEDAIHASREFDAWLEKTVYADTEERNERLIGWSAAPSARLCHPREEHLIPLMVVAGAADGEPGVVSWRGTVNGLSISAHRFG